MSDNTTEDTGLTQEEIDVIEEKEMIDEGAPVSPATEPVAETAERMEAAHERAEEAEGDAGETGVDEPTFPVDDSIVEAHERAVEQTQESLEASDDAAEQTPEEAAAAALGDTEAVDEEAEKRRRLREFTRELKKLPGQWYIIQSYSGYENKVKTNLDMRAQTLEVEDSIYDVVVPIEQAVELKDGKRKLVKRKLLPGYVLVRMDMNDAAWSVVRETPGVTSFVGNEGNATPVKHRDVAKFLMPKEAPVDGDEAAAKTVTNSEGETVVATPGEEAKKIAHDFEVGEAVTILSGALASVSATINAIDEETGKIQALVSIFGRETPVELTADQVERIN
ncbi:transcription termination/antitermination protein NusG [Corynebacterium pilosum]|uniref:Transcription termination/antitermination protein NusG n=1 Tax=Corynebacterium pilosum TaxID=35756 RepID=A0A376CNA5_9CORY|nr:transcription termination/antitermination protein NusG [Corynebacterium pilosum]STC69589.1 transcription antitermination protein NusG [Corynebacterium pilosum]